MDQHTDTTWTANVGISRRTLLRRGAVVGGALLWTTPIVQSIPHPAFAAGSPPPPDGTAISFVAVVVTCADGRTFRAKFNTDGTDAGWEPDPGPPVEKPNSTCYPANYWNSAGTESIDGGAHGLQVSVDGVDPSKAAVTVPGVLTGLGSEDCVVVRVDATGKGGQECTSGSATSAPFAVDLDL